MEEYAPTGMRYESMEPDEAWHVIARNDQRVRFGAELAMAGELVYYARCVAPGELCERERVYQFIRRRDLRRQRAAGAAYRKLNRW